MQGRHYINSMDTYTQWGCVIGTIEGLNFPKRKVAYSKNWEYSSGTDVILGGYESRELTLTCGISADSATHIRSKIDKFLRDLAAMGEFVLYDANRREGAVCVLADENSRKVTPRLMGGYAILKVKLMNYYPCCKTFIASSAAAQTVAFTLKNAVLPCKIYWGDGTSQIATTGSVSKQLAAGTWHVVVATDTEFNPEQTVTGATVSLNI